MFSFTKPPPIKSHTLKCGVKIESFDFSGFTTAQIKTFCKGTPAQDAPEKHHRLWFDAHMALQSRS